MQNQQIPEFNLSAIENFGFGGSFGASVHDVLAALTPDDKPLDDENTTDSND